jgi:DNA-binding XRE family transcriptional regulator
MINAAQCRIARAAIRMTVDDLAREAKIGRVTVICFERGDGVLPMIKAKICATFEGAGILFLDNGSVRPPQEAA